MSFSSELWSVVTLSFACGRFTDAAVQVFAADDDSDGEYFEYDGDG